MANVGMATENEINCLVIQRLLYNLFMPTPFKYYLNKIEYDKHEKTFTIYVYKAKAELTLVYEFHKYAVMENDEMIAEKIDELLKVVVAKLNVLY